jgi:hypothetical protein
LRQLLTYHLSCGFRGDLALFNLPLQSKHLKKGCIQTILSVHLKKRRVVEVQDLILLLKLLLIRQLVSLQGSPRLLGRIHIPNKRLDLRCRQILVIDSAQTSRNFGGREFTKSLGHAYTRSSGFN